jgi:PilZ domain-containing protein
MDLKAFLSRFIPKQPSDRAVAVAAGVLDQRIYLRSKITSRIDLSWQDAEGRKRHVESRGVNMSSVGALVLSPEPIAVGAAVSLNSKDLQLMGNATVRHCTERGSQFLVGLEFRGSLVRS